MPGHILMWKMTESAEGADNAADDSFPIAGALQ
jgi:hypothetical protein